MYYLILCSCIIQKNMDKDEDDVTEHGRIQTRTKMMSKNTEKYGPGRR